MRTWMIITVALVGLAIGVPAEAGLLATDSFEDYTLGQLEDGSGFVEDHGSGWSEPWKVLDAWRTNINVVSHAMSYSNGSVNVDGGQQAISITPFDAVHGAMGRAFAGQSGTLYMSLLFQAPTISDNTAPNSTNDFFQFGYSNDGPGTSSNTQASGGIADSGGAQKYFARYGTSSSTFGATVDPLDTYFLIVKAQKDGTSYYNRVSLFINPDSNVEGDQTNVILASGNTGLNSISTWLFRLARHETVDQYYVDQLTLGDSFESVIPEPASVTLLAVGALALLRRRRA